MLNRFVKLLTGRVVPKDAAARPPMEPAAMLRHSDEYIVDHHPGRPDTDLPVKVIRP